MQQQFDIRNRTSAADTTLIETHAQLVKLGFRDIVAFCYNFFLNPGITILKVVGYENCV